MEDIVAGLKASADDCVRIYVTRLRKKLEPGPKQLRYILTERGIGYRLVDSKATLEGVPGTQP